MKSIFISHVSEEAAVARALKEGLESIFIDHCNVFVSSDGENTFFGEKWMGGIDQALREAHLLLVVCSPISLRKPWISFETGCIWNRNIPILPICHSGQSLEDLPRFLSEFPALSLEGGCRTLVQAVARALGMPKSEYPARSLASFSRNLKAAIKKCSGGRSSLYKQGDQEIAFKNLAKDATSIGITAWSGSAFFDENEKFLLERVASGCRVRIILVPETGSASSTIMECSGVKELVGDIRKMKDKSAQFCRRVAGSKGSFEVREVNWVTPFGMISIGSADGQGQISIGLHPLYLPTPRGERRFILVSSRTSPKDFDYFQEQLENLWSSASPVCSSENAR